MHLGEIIHAVAVVSVSHSLDGGFYKCNNPLAFIRNFFLGHYFSKKQRFICLLCVIGWHILV